MNTRKLQITFLLAGSLVMQGAFAQQKPMPKPAPKPKAAPVQQMSPQRVPGGGPAAPGAPGKMPMTVGPLLDSAALSKQPTYSKVEEGMKNPTKVYKLILTNQQNFPPGIERFSNLQVLEIYGVQPPQMDQPEMPEMPGGGDMPPPPPPMGGPMPGGPGGPGMEFPMGIYEMKNLTTLRIHQMGIKGIGKEISKLTNLKVLDLNDNPIASVPESLGELKNLTEFRISQGMTPSLPVSMGKIANLKILETTSNNIPEIKSLRELNIHSMAPNPPGGLEKLVNVRKITYNSGMIQAPMIVAEFSKMPNLQEVVFPTGMFSFQDLESLAQLRKLTSLEFASLRVDMRPPPTISGFETLKELKIWKIYCKNPGDYAEIYRSLSMMNSKPAITVEFNKAGTEFFPAFRDLNLIINQSDLNFESLKAPTLRGIILGSRIKTWPMFLGNIPALENLDISKARIVDYGMVGSSINTMIHLKNLTVSADALKAIAGSLNQLKSLTSFTVTPGTGRTPPISSQERDNIYKSLPKTKITFIN